MIEVDLETGRGFAYGTESLELLRRHACGECRVERVERLPGLVVYTVAVPGLSVAEGKFSLLEPGEMECVHGERICYESVNRLPQDGWQELIDCWSCHDSEFRGMLDLKIRPRRMGILTSNFYFIAHESVLPPCCSGRSKLFYGDVVTRHPRRSYIYKFFEEYFESKNSIVLEHGGRCHEIKYFYRCAVIGDGISSAIKVGVKETDKPSVGSDFIDAAFVDGIFDEIAGNSIGIQILRYDLSFIRQE